MRLYAPVYLWHRGDLERNLISDNSACWRKLGLATGSDSTSTEWYGSGRVCYLTIQYPHQTKLARMSPYMLQMQNQVGQALVSKGMFGNCETLCQTLCNQYGSIAHGVADTKIEGCIYQESMF